MTRHAIVSVLGAAWTATRSAFGPVRQENLASGIDADPGIKRSRQAKRAARRAAKLAMKAEKTAARDRRGQLSPGRSSAADKSKTH